MFLHPASDEVRDVIDLDSLLVVLRHRGSEGRDVAPSRGEGPAGDVPDLVARRPLSVFLQRAADLDQRNAIPERVRPESIRPDAGPL